MSKKVQPEEDLDDLDDVLEQFSVPPPPKLKGPAGPPPPTSANESFSLDPDLSDEFAKELAAGMESLMRELGNPPDEASSLPDTEGIRKAWEQMILDDLKGGASVDDLFPGGKPPPGMEQIFANLANIEQSRPKVAERSSGVEQQDFQATIQQAMEKLKDSDDTLKADTTSNSDPLAALFSSLGDLNLSDGASGQDAGDGDLQNMLETMMSQLMSKEILYEPLKELDEKFPEYMSKNEATLSTEDKTRYNKQKELITQIVAIFDAPGYSDDNQEMSAKVLTLMHEMQSHGSPPSEIMGPLPPGVDLGADGLPKMPDGCVSM